MAMSRRGRSVIGAAALLVVPLAPVVALQRIGLGSSWGTWVMATVTACLATVLVDAALGLRASAALAIATGLGFSAATNPWLASLVMAAGAAAYGIASRWGVSSAIAMAPIALGFTIAEPTPVLRDATSTANALALGAIVVGAGLWGTLVGWALGRRLPRRTPVPLSLSRAGSFAAIMAVVAGIMTWFVCDLRLGHNGSWMLLTVFVVIQPYVQDTWRKSLERLAGTVAGFAVVLVVAVITGIPWVLDAIGIACMVVAIVIRLEPGSRYWAYATFLTAAVVLLEGAGGSVIDTDRNRLIATVVGGAVALAVVAITLPFYRRGARQHGLDRY